MNVLGWVLRALMAVGGIVLVWAGWPVAAGSLQAQRADAVMTDLSKGKPLARPQVMAGLEALNRGVAADPTASRYIQRAALLGAAALTPSLKASPSEQSDWLQRAKTDLDTGLAAAPARGIGWLRLALVRQALDGSPRSVLPPLFMSIETAPLNPFLWPGTLRAILDNWAYFSDEQRDQLRSYVATTWRRSPDKRWLVALVRDPTDELILRFFLRNEPGAQDELTKFLKAAEK